MTMARLFLSPLDGPRSELEIVEPTRLLDLFPDAEVHQWFKEGGGTVLVNGHQIPPEHWRLITLKPHEYSNVDFIYVPRGKKTFVLLASVALVALTAAISGGLLGPAAAGTIGTGILGSSFAAGSVGANLLAAGVGLAGSLAISALSAPPRAANSGGDQRSANQGGVTGNTVTALDTLPVIFGKIGAAPPHLVPPYTEWDGDNIIAYACVGVQGRCLIENLRLNGLPIGNFANLTYETREGGPGDAARTLFNQSIIEERDGITLSNFLTEGNSNKNDTLTDQAVPANSSPQWHYFQTAGTWTEFVLRFMFPSGIVRTDSGDGSVVPLRIEIRKKGSVSWRRLPTFHFYDSNKGNGPMRAEIRVKRARPPGGPHFSWAGDEYPISSVNNYTGITKTWAYEADAYFGSGEVFDLQGYGPIMTNYTTSGVTISASSDSVSAAWRASDGPAGSTTTYWQPANNSLPASITYDFGSAVQFGSYLLKSNFSSFSTTPAEAPTAWYVEGSNNGTTWTNLGVIDNTEFNQPVGVYQIESPGSYRYYKLTVTANNGASNQQMRISELRWYTNDAWGSYLGDGGLAGEYGTVHRENTSITNRIKSKYVRLNKKGADVYLDPASWDDGEYEIRIKRGWSFNYSSFSDTTSYSYSGTGTAYFFDPQQDGAGLWKIFQGQKRYRSDSTIECFQTIDANETPFDGTGVALIAIAVPNVQISSIYAEFTRYAPIWTGTRWSDPEVPTSNPAALYRQLLLGGANAKPVPGECVDEDALVDWYQTCVTKGYEANAMMQGSRVADAKQMLATCGYATPRDADSYAVIEDKDTTSDPVRYLITPLNSRDEGTTQDLPDIPDAIRAEFNDATKNYAVEHAIIYRDGMTAATAKIFETFSYQGFTALAKVTARANFDLKQAQVRQIRYNRRVGFDGIVLKRGMVVGLSCDVIDGDKAAGLITAITTDGGGNVVSITLDNIMPWSASTDIEEVSDAMNLTDALNPSQPMGVFIRIPGSVGLLKQVSDVSDSNVCTFTTPFPFAGSGLAVGQLVAAGVFGNEIRRCKIMAIYPKGIEERQLVLADEAPSLYV